MPPRSLLVRPTTDYAKEGLFNILEHTFDFEELEVLDLFAGTGSISYEFASRGCKSVVCVEKNRQCAAFIKDTIRKLDFSNITLVEADVLRFVKSARKKFSIVFADPPYQLEELASLPQLILSNDLLYASGWLILEHPGSYDFSNHAFFLELRKYGEVHFSIFGLPEA